MKLPKDEREAGLCAIRQYLQVRGIPEGQMKLMVNAVLRASARVRERRRSDHWSRGVDIDPDRMKAFLDGVYPIADFTEYQ